ncbi:MAG: hypothetical protein LBO05_05230 [Deltaproteobacteria bacterium]|nr:hypothetical protein [Deltaproteobacteria bacterium]
METKMADFQQPRWVQEIQKYLFVKSQFALWGNINDIYVIESEGGTAFQPLADSLVKILLPHKYDLVMEFTPLTGFRTLHAARQENQEKAPPKTEGVLTLQAAADLLEKTSRPGRPLSATLLNFSLRLPDICRRDIDEFYYRLYRLSLASRPSRPRPRRGAARTSPATTCSSGSWTRRTTSRPGTPWTTPWSAPSPSPSRTTRPGRSRWSSSPPPSPGTPTWARGSGRPGRPSFWTRRTGFSAGRSTTSPS